MLRWRVPALDLVSDDEDTKAEPVQESVLCLRPLRSRQGILHPPAGSVIEMDLPDVTVEDWFCGSMVDILNTCVNGMKDPMHLQSCAHAFDFTPMSSWQAFTNLSMPIFLSYVFARIFSMQFLRSYVAYRCIGRRIVQGINVQIGQPLFSVALIGLRRAWERFSLLFCSRAWSRSRW